MRFLTIAALSFSIAALATASVASAQSKPPLSELNNVHPGPIIRQTNQSAVDEPWRYHPCMANVVTADGRHTCLND